MAEFTTLGGEVDPDLTVQEFMFTVRSNANLQGYFGDGFAALPD